MDAECIETMLPCCPYPDAASAMNGPCTKTIMDRHRSSRDRGQHSLMTSLEGCAEWGSGGVYRRRGEEAGDSFPVSKSRFPSGSLVPRLRVSSPPGSFVPHPNYSKCQAEPRPQTPKPSHQFVHTSGSVCVFFETGNETSTETSDFLICCCTTPGL